MEKKEENNTGVNQSFKLSAIVGIWESLNLHPTVMIYQSKKIHFLSMLHVSDNGQAKPAVYEIQKEDNRYFIVEVFKRLYISYNAVKIVFPYPTMASICVTDRCMYVNHSNQL